MLLAALVVGILLRPDPLLVAREVAGKPAVEPSGTSWNRARVAVRERPVLGFAVAGLAAAHAAMVGVMVMTPLHMEHGGAELRGDRDRDQRPRARHVRVLAAGRHARRPARSRSGCLPAGGGILVLSLLLCAWAPEGAHWQIFAGLFLLGLGWSFAMVSASTMVADHAPLDARTDVQGAADLVMGVTAAGAGALAGLVVGLAGYPVLALVTLSLALGVVVAAARAAQLAE